MFLHQFLVPKQIANRCGSSDYKITTYSGYDIITTKERMRRDTERSFPPEKDACKQRLEKCVISISAYGSNPLFWNGAIANVREAKKVYPGWKVRIYHNSSIAPEIMAQLRMLDNAELVEELEIKGGSVAGMFWRFLIADDTSVDRYIVRDADSRPSWRERAAVNEWISSGRTFHIMRDNPCHGTQVLGGMWGGLKGGFPFLVRAAILSEKGRPYLLPAKGSDQDFLTNFLYSTMRNSVMCHDSHLCQVYEGCQPFPTQNLLPGIFVGFPGIFSFEDLPRGEKDNTTLSQTYTFRAQTCPVQCRPFQHLNWVYC